MYVCMFVGIFILFVAYKWFVITCWKAFLGAGNIVIIIIIMSRVYA
jgi:hypothetical protein